MAAINLARRIGNKLYEVAFPLYRPLYIGFKALADRAERDLIASSVGQGSIVVDAGANIGVYSRFLARCVGDSGVVHSFEPAPANFARLRDTVGDLANVRTNQLAVSDRTGHQFLYISTTLNVDHRTYPTDGEPRRIVSVGSVRLDDYFTSGQRVDLIKLDIQGYELHALRGTERVLADNPNIKLLVEFWPQGLRSAGSSPQALLDHVRDHGFALFIFQHGKLKACGERIDCAEDNSEYFNLFARRC